MSLFIRKCLPSDLDQLIHISRKTFADAFEKDNNPVDFKAYIDVAFSADKLSEELQNPNTAFHLVYQDTELPSRQACLVGYFKLNENEAQTDLKSGKGIELERIYILKDFQGQQIGSWILDEAKKIASVKQKTYLWLGVWEKNPRAIQFYQKHNFLKFGTHPYYIGNDKQTDWLMRFDLIS